MAMTTTCDDGDNGIVLPIKGTGHTWTTVWSGGFPNLCDGNWTLFCDGVEVPLGIPEFDFEHDELEATDFPFVAEVSDGFRIDRDAHTKGVYYTWSFGSDWNEVWSPYIDGLDSDEWCETYATWLATIAAEPSEWPSVFAAFQKNDWRSNSCGGCI